MNEHVLKLTGISKRFKGHQAVSDVNLSLEKGRVMALIGPNGAGKTTTIRMILDLLRPDCGSVSVFGLNPATDAVSIRRQCGYVPERPRMIPWMTVHQIKNFVSSFYPSWDPAYAESLLERCRLRTDQKVKNLSRGEEAKLALILGLAFRPNLLVLDDATSGIDPAARRDILENVIRHIHESGTTILFATHLVHEVEGLADEAVFMIGGRIRCCGRIDDLKQRIKRLVSWTDHALPPVPAGASVLHERREGRCTERVIDGFRPEDLQANRYGLEGDMKLEVHDMSLEEIYLAFHDGSNGGL